MPLDEGAVGRAQVGGDRVTLREADLEMPAGDAGVSRYRWPSMSRIGWLGVALAEAAGAAPPRRVEDSISMAGAVRSASGAKETLTGPTKE